MSLEKRIYVVLPATVQVPAFPGAPGKTRHVLQPHGRQIAQACHVVSKLRHSVQFDSTRKLDFQPVTTIILQARDSNEMMHNYVMLNKRTLFPVFFSDENRDAYGDFRPITALAVWASQKQVAGILDYLPLWGS